MRAGLAARRSRVRRLDPVDAERGVLDLLVQRDDRR
jgi:hypothetical protein